MHEAAEVTYAVLILAAGQGRRMGRIKAMAPWRGGNLLEDAIGRARQLNLPVQVVAGAGYPLVRFRCSVAPSRWTPVPDWSLGMAESLKRGLERTPVHRAGVLVMTVDQPLVPVAHLRRLLERARAYPGRPVATEAGGRAMVPAYLPKSLWPELARIRGDEGARHLLRGVGVTTLPCAEAAQDLDTWAALRQADAGLITR